MYGTASKEMEVHVPACEAWELYGTLKMAKFSVDRLPHLFHKIEVVQGDGGAGTILNLIFPPGIFFGASESPPGISGFSSYKEKFTKVDNEKRVKEVEVFEGGYLDMGFNLFRYQVEIVEKCEKSCMIKSSIEYDANEGVDPNIALVALQFLVLMMEAVGNYLIE